MHLFWTFCVLWLFIVRAVPMTPLSALSVFLFLLLCFCLSLPLADSYQHNDMGTHRRRQMPARRRQTPVRRQAANQDRSRLGMPEPRPFKERESVWCFVQRLMPPPPIRMFRTPWHSHMLMASQSLHLLLSSFSPSPCSFPGVYLFPPPTWAALWHLHFPILDLDFWLNPAWHSVEQKISKNQEKGGSHLHSEGLHVDCPLSLANFPLPDNSEMEMLISSTHLQYPFKGQMRAWNKLMPGLQAWKSSLLSGSPRKYLGPLPLPSLPEFFWIFFGYWNW